MPLSRWPRPALSVSLIGTLAFAAAYKLSFPDRSDYVGHFLAGAGGTLLLLTVVVEMDRRGRWPVVLGVWTAVLLGVIAEATVFRLAEFDLVDLANQSLGAVFAGFGMLDGRAGDRSTAVAGIAGLVFLVAGFGYAFA